MKNSLAFLLSIINRKPLPDFGERLFVDKVLREYYFALAIEFFTLHF